PRNPPAGGLHVAGLLARDRADGAAEPGLARPAVPGAQGGDRGARRGPARAVRPGGRPRRPARLTSPGAAPVAVACRGAFSPPPASPPSTAEPRRRPPGAV